ncbi:methylated-DNA-protein-cysteine methyltransferase-like protein [Hydrogenispora ethanolica]|uniref:Methylated-DNA-protein-cysteine methyltransferase-like protein n=1 Tax=Hydrogenispora ethanolica TaxID=1082276 RepID=A0A4R1QVX9_HYDET|nr:methylated-DNA--[protein]-cysteine S-methyltransferase [Hydrogenispora ethanolica]TCL56805.1 methylated-DNA-protein-cysteine methyltransferase-like protein [Hydrogenispora ethanolica]
MKFLQGFFQEVYEVVQRVPAGKAVTYGQIAAWIGRPHSARVVGWAMRVGPEGLPWHRVVNRHGGLAPGCELEQRLRLAAEGVTFTSDGRVDLKRHGWSVQGD